MDQLFPKEASADSSLLIPPWHGFLIGIVATVIAFGVLALIGSFTQLSLATFIAQTGEALWSGSRDPVRLWVGSSFYVGIGSLLGVLYALCQVRAADDELIGVGLFYGLSLWIVSYVIGARVLPQPLHGEWSGWMLLVGWLVYGLMLACAAIWIARANPNSAPSPRD